MIKANRLLLVGLLLAVLWLAGCAPAAAPTQQAAPAAPFSPTRPAPAGTASPITVPATAAPAAPSQPLSTPVQSAANPAGAPSSTTDQHQAVPTSTSPSSTPPAAALSGASTAAAEDATKSTRPTASPPAGQSAAAPTSVSTAFVEKRMLELEYPREIQLGESDLLRLALVPYLDSYTVTTEFPEHTVSTQTVTVKRPKGFLLKGIARLDAAGFEVAPQAEQEALLTPGETVTWRWSLVPRSPGRQRLAVTLLLRWEPEAGVSGPSTQVEAFSRALELNVSSVLGLTRPQAVFTGFSGLVFGGVFSLTALLSGRRAPRRFSWRTLSENPRVVIEPFPGLKLGPSENSLLRALFNRYSRLVVENEFLSGYSGARTILARPIRPDGQADAATIIKMGPRRSVQGEFENYEAFVKDRLPPITARIQQPPVTVGSNPQAALQYTFIAEPGRQPISLRQALLQTPDPALLMHLFDSFGPAWWLQRQPATFRWGEEYDRMLPPHAVLKPLGAPAAAGLKITPANGPSQLALSVGSLVNLHPFTEIDLRADGRSLTLTGLARPGEAALRLRWLDSRAPTRPTSARVTALRADLLAELTRGLSLEGLPDPLARLPALLYQSITATRSVIHGDLNLENVLVGPGGFVWLIDFARTRSGHPLFDFAHLEAEIIAHIIAPRRLSPPDFLNLLKSGADPLLAAVESIAGRCQFNPSQPQEYRAALSLACLGALKYSNLPPEARQLLYLTAAFYLWNAPVTQ